METNNVRNIPTKIGVASSLTVPYNDFIGEGLKLKRVSLMDQACPPFPWGWGKQVQ